MISDVTDKILVQIEEWQNRPLDDVYPVIYIAAIHYFSQRQRSDCQKSRLCHSWTYLRGRKEVLPLAISENESAKFRLNALNELKKLGVQDVTIICADGLTDIKEAVSAAFPKTDYQCCMVHMVSNTLKYVASKDMKSFASDLKSIYNAVSEDEGQKARERVVEKWAAKYPTFMKR